MIPVIESRKNELVKECARLGTSAALRREKGRCLLEGARLCADAAENGVRIEFLFFTQEAAQKYAAALHVLLAAAEKAFQVSPSVAALLSDTKTTQGVFCVCEITSKQTGLPPLLPGTGYLALENIQNPANLGAALRTAEAFGISGVILGGESRCDIWSPKALRAAMGAVFRLPLFEQEDMPGAVVQLRRLGFVAYAAVPDRTALPVTRADFSVPCVVVVGNEGSGLSESTQQSCSQRITIPMAGRAESLNAAASAAILMWEMTGAGRGGKEHV